ncbi:MAG: FAD-dependent oxidoreductase [Planctomycetota bacterium]|jgi:3-oxosteroid 1-dehydrogenase
MRKWDEEVDVVVVGSGGGGLVAALHAADRGASVLVLERGPLFGGTSAMSGGAIWVPANEHMTAAGISDDPEAALTYLRSTVGVDLDEARARAYVHSGPELLRFVESRTPLRFRPLLGYPDYFCERPGGLPSGRTLGVQPIEAPQSELARRMLEPHPQTRMFFGFDMMDHAHEAPRLFSSGLRDRAWSGKRMLGRVAARSLRLLRSKRRLCVGQAIIAHLLAAAEKRGARLWSQAPAIDLVEEGGRIVGAVVERRGQKRRVHARKAVLLAAGGFERNAELLRAHHPSPTRPTWTAGAPHSYGDAIRMAQGVGAELRLMDSALLAPVVAVPGARAAHIIAIEKGMPGAVVVDSEGKRFADESLPFPAFAQAMRDHTADPSTQGQAAPAYVIVDTGFRRRYPLGPILPSFMQPDWAARRVFDMGLIHRADSLPQLAAKLGLAAATLTATIERWNGHAATGDDPDFGRGRTVMAKFYGDAGTPHRNLGPLTKAPFYAMPIYPGNLGTLGGVAVDADGRALRPDGTTIDGLFAVGNCAAPLVGRVYPASGLTLGPAMVFAHRAMAAALTDTQAQNQRTQRPRESFMSRASIACDANSTPTACS